MENFLGNDSLTSIESLAAIDREHYKTLTSTTEPLNHFIKVGRFSGLSVRAFDQGYFLSQYPNFEEEVRAQLKDPSSLKSISDVIAVFFRERVHFAPFDASDREKEKQFWREAELPYDINTVVTYTIEQKFELLLNLPSERQTALLEQHIQDRVDGLLGSHLALILATFAMNLNRPITAEYFLLQHDYGVAWSYPVRVQADRAVFPICDARTYIERTGNALGEHGAFKFARLENVVSIGGTSLLLVNGNQLIEQKLDANTGPSRKDHPVRMVSDDGSFVAIQYPLPVATLKEINYISLADERSAKTVFFAHQIVPAVEACQKVMKNIGYVLHDATPRVIEKLFDSNPPRSVKYLTSDASVRLDKTVILGLNPESGPSLLASNARAILKRLQNSPQDTSDNWQRTVVVGQNAKFQSLLNSEEVQLMLEGAGFEFEEASDISSEATMETYRESKCIVVMPGQELVHIVFCSRGTKVLLIDDGTLEESSRFSDLTRMLGIDLTVIKCSQIEKNDGVISWLKPGALTNALERIVGGTPTAQSRINEQAQVYSRQLQKDSLKADPESALKGAINMAGRLVYWSRKVNYMMIDQPFNKAAYQVFERALKGYAPNPTQRKTEGAKKRLKVCILASQLYDTGGHTRLIEDILSSQSSFFDIDILLTNLKDRQGPLTRNGVMWPSQSVYTAKNGTMVEKARSIHDLIEKLDPDVILNMSHPYDLLAYGFMVREKKRRSLYVVHSDHTFSFLPDPKTAELLVVTEPCGSNFKAQSIPHTKLALASDKEKLIDYEPYSSPVSDGLLTMTVGPQHKFYTRGSMKYSDLLVSRFSGADGKHVHVGHLPDDFMEELSSVLEPLGYMDRFMCIGFVPSVHKTIHDLQVDMLIGSYPVGGGKAPVEAMAAGCPICQCDDGRWGNGEPMVYPEALRWKTMNELKTIISRVDRQTLMEQRNYSRSYYLKNHSMDLFTETLRAAIAHS